MNTDSLKPIAELVRTQDNRMTQDPLFAVQQRRRIYGMDGEHSGGDEDKLGHIWLKDGEEVDARQARRLNQREREGGSTDGYEKCHYLEIWEFVTACFTEQGCKDFLAVNGHNLKKPRIYAYSGYRNAEWIKMRQFLKELDQPSQPE